MHIILGILGVVAAIAFYASRISRGAADIADAANTLGNIPRKRRFQKHARASGFALIETPVEAATALMVAVANLATPRAMTPDERAHIHTALTQDMDQDTETADDIITQVEAILYDVLQPAGAVPHAVRILHPILDRPTALRLSRNLVSVANAGANSANIDQKNMISTFRDRMGLTA